MWGKQAEKERKSEQHQAEKAIRKAERKEVISLRIMAIHCEETQRKYDVMPEILPVPTQLDPDFRPIEERGRRSKSQEVQWKGRSRTESLNLKF